MRGAAGGGRAAGRQEPLRGVRRAIAEHLARSHREVPAVTVVEECDFTHLSLTRGELSYLPFVLRATAEALGRHAALNARLERDEIVYLDDVHLGVAMQTEAGLVVPVVRHATSKTVEQLATEVTELGAAAAAGTLTPEQLRGSTFTVSSAGLLAPVMLTALVVTQTLGGDEEIHVDARAVGVGAACVAIALRAHIIVAMAIAALRRLRSSVSPSRSDARASRRARTRRRPRSPRRRGWRARSRASTVESAAYGEFSAYVPAGLRLAIPAGAAPRTGP